MSPSPSVSFLSLFVPDLEKAAAFYASIFGVSPSTDDPDVPTPHPFAAAGPVVFALGPVKLALYQANQQVTHPGDVGIGVVLEEPPADLCRRVTEQGGQVFFGPKPQPGSNHHLAAFVLPDRHFFDVLGPGS